MLTYLLEVGHTLVFDLDQRRCAIPSQFHIDDLHCNQTE